MAITLTIGSERGSELTEVIVDALGLSPGDAVEVDLTGPDEAAVRRVRSPFDFDAFMAKHRVNEPYDDRKIREEAEEALAEEGLAKMFGRNRG